MATMISSAQGTLALLDEPEPELQVRAPLPAAPGSRRCMANSDLPLSIMTVLGPISRQEHALQTLDEIVDMFWTEISESISKMCAPRPPEPPQTFLSVCG